LLAVRYCRVISDLLSNLWILYC